MSREKQRLQQVAASEMAAYRREAAARSPESLARIRAVLSVGGLGAQLQLDTVPGVVWAKVTDCGASHVVMPSGQVLVEVWGGRPIDVFRTVRAEAPAGIMAVVVWREAGLVQRVKRWGRFRLWLVERWWRGLRGGHR